MNKVSLLKFSMVLLMLLACLPLVVPTSVAQVSEGDAASAIADAENVIISAYEVILEAERAGANASVLLDRLNEAEGFLTRARIAYSMGNFDEAASLADSGKNIGEEVKGAGVDLKDLSLAQSLQNMWVTAIGSFGSAVLILLGSFWVWRVFKRRYFRQVLKMKPEAATYES